MDEKLFMGAAAKIHEFLNIELLIQPGRLRFYVAAALTDSFGQDGRVVEAGALGGTHD